MKINDVFRKFAAAVSAAVGKPQAFIIALAVIITWASTGPIFGFSNTWQLFINTGTTIVTLLMVFLIQNTQNRDSKAIHLKLDELLKSNTRARNELVDIEDQADDIMEHLHEQSAKLQQKYHKKLREEVDGKGKKNK